MSRWIVDASLALGWYLKDEADRAYNLDVLAGLKKNEAQAGIVGERKTKR